MNFFRCVTDIEIVKVNSVCYVRSGTQYRWKLLRVLETYAMGSKMRTTIKSINCTTSQQCPSGVNSARRFVEDLIGFEARKLQSITTGLYIHKAHFLWYKYDSTCVGNVFVIIFQLTTNFICSSSFSPQFSIVLRTNPNFICGRTCLIQRFS